MSYAKTLVPSTPPVPLLVATTREPVLLRQLAGYGFVDPAEYGGFGQASAARVVIDHTHLALVVDGQVLLDDAGGDPAAPDGWWRAVDRLGGLVDVWITTADLDSGSDDLGPAMARLMDVRGMSMSALVPIEHSAPDSPLAA